MTRIVEPTDERIAEAAERLRQGLAVAFPTETVYGLGAAILCEKGLRTVYEMKNRPGSNPLIAHVADLTGAERVTTGWDARCRRLADRFWPGPLAIVLPKASEVPSLATGGRETIAVRMPRHSVAARLINSLGTPISAPSANRSGLVSPTSALHVADSFADESDLMILDGGACEIGLESTVLDLTGDTARVLRSGAVTHTELCEELGFVELPGIGSSSTGRFISTPVELVDPKSLAIRLAELKNPAAVLCFEAAVVPAHHRAIEMPQGAGDYARQMYQALREADAMKLSCVIIEEPPTGNDTWEAIRARLVLAVSGKAE